jgi:uncharacterized protein YndB with AHSA1/START domain
MSPHPVRASHTGMLIRKPVSLVYEAFVDPAITTRFWFTHGSGRLDAGKPVEWRWAMYDVVVTVTPKAIEPNRRILIEWPGDPEPRTVEWHFEPVGPDATFVRITESGFTASGAELVSQVADSTGGFTLALAGAKAWLEHGLELNLVADRFPTGITEH